MIRLTNKKHPRILFLPTASSDSKRYWKHVQEYFGGFLKCKTDVLFFTSERVSKATVDRKIRGADMVYVGGGNTLQMMRVWRRLGVDKLLKSAYENGTLPPASVQVPSAGLILDTLIRCPSPIQETGITSM